MALVGSPGEGVGVVSGIRVVGVALEWSARIAYRVAAVGAQKTPPRPPPASRLETAKSDRGEDDPHDAHQIDLEAQAEGHGQESQINCRGRREADRRPARDQVLGTAGQEKATEKLAEE